MPDGGSDAAVAFRDCDAYDHRTGLSCQRPEGHDGRHEASPYVEPPVPVRTWEATDA